MGKKSTKVLSGALATTSLLGGVMGAVPAFAATNLDTLYAEALTAVQKAEKDKTQESITAAREAITRLNEQKNLDKALVEMAVGEFSRVTDAVQQKLFVEFYSLLYVDGKEKSKMTQEEINKAREAVLAFNSYKGNQQYTASWSSAVDGFQQKNINEVYVAVEKAQKSKDIKDVEVAKKLLEELAKSTNADTKNEAVRLTGEVAKVEKEIEEAIIKVESVSAINATTVQLTVPSTVKEADLVGKKVALTVGETVLTATYMDGSLADAKANFLLDGAKKVVDATSYKMTADWASFADTFMAKIPGTVKYAKTFEMVTVSVPEAATTDLYFTAKDQYGDAIAITDLNNDNLTVEVKKNGMPLNATEVPAITAAANVVEGKIKVHINKLLVKGDTLEITLGNRRLAGDAETAFKAQPIKLTVGDKLEGAVGAVDIKGITATYAAANNEHKIGDAVVDVLPTDKVTLAANVVNQLGNPAETVPGGLVRWTVEEVSGTGVVGVDVNDITEVAGRVWNDAKTIDTQDNKFTFSANKPGTLKVTAYNIANGKNVSWTIKIGAAKLNANLAAPTFTTAGTNNPYNHENYVSNAVAYNEEAVLTPEMIKFEVTSVPAGATKDDIQLTAAYGTTDATKNQIFITAKTNKVGAYKFKAYVGESFAKAISVFAESTVTTVVNPTVDKIEVAEVKANELQAGKDLVKEIKFSNKWNEQVDVKKSELTLAPTTGLTVTAMKDSTTQAGANDKVTHVKFSAPAKGSYVANFVAGPKSLSLPVTVAETGMVQSITLGKATTTVIQSDSYDAKSDTDDVVVINDGGNKAFKLIAVSAKDSYGNDVALAPDNFDIKEGNQAPANVTIKYFKGLKADDVITGATKGVKYIGIYSEVDASAADVQKTLTIGTHLDKIDGFAAPQLTATVKKARALKDVTVTPVASTIASINGQVKYKVTAVDQYNTPFAIEQATANLFKVVANDNYEQVNSEQANLNTLDNGSAIVTIKGKVAGEYTPVVYNDADANGTMNDKEINKTVALKVQELGDAINSLTIAGKAEVTPSGIAKYETDLAKYPVQVVKNAVNTIKLTPKAFDASNNEVAFDATNLIWSVKSVNLKYANDTGVDASNVTVANGIVTIHPTVDQELSGTIVIKVATLNGKVAEKTISVTSEVAKAQSGTYYLAKADATDKAINSIVLNKDDANGVEEVVLVAKDQYGREINVSENANGVLLGQDSSAYFTKAADDDSINVTAKAVGSSILRVFVNGNQEATLTITVDQDAVDAANKTAADSVKALIVALPAKDAVQIGNKAAVTAARTAYNNLTADQKALVGDITKLTEAEAKIAELDGAAQADIQSVATAKAALEVTPTGGDANLTSVKNAVTLGAATEGTAIAWASSDTNIVANNGTVTRPIFSAGDKDVTLTATITKNAANDTKVFNIKVLKKDFTVAPAGTADNTFTITSDGYALTDFTAVANIDMDSATDGIQNSITENGLTYTVTYDNATGKATVAVTGTATAKADAVTKTITVTKDGKTVNLNLNIPTVEANAAANTVNFTITQP